MDFLPGRAALNREISRPHLPSITSPASSLEEGSDIPLDLLEDARSQRRVSPRATIPLPIRHWLLRKKPDAAGRHLILLSVATTAGSCLMIFVLFTLVFIFKPISLDSTLPHDYISDNPILTDGKPIDGLSKWLEDFSHSVIPKKCHSHNDYWRPYPLFSALAAGCTGVEADIWLTDDGTDLLVGHDPGSLSRNRTLRSMYLDPLLEILESENPASTWANHTPYDRARGVFKQQPNTTLVLLIDVKSNANATWPLVLAQLEPLRRQQFLTRHEHIYTSPGFETKQARWPQPVTVVGTGGLDKLTLTRSRAGPGRDFYAYHDAFIDAPLGLLPDENHFYEGLQENGMRWTGSSQLWDAEDAYYASVSFKQTIGSVSMGFSEAQLDMLRKQIKVAQQTGLKTRYWDLPDWPVGYRDYIWRTLVKEGVDMLNVDDLESAARRGWADGSSYLRDVIWMGLVSLYIFLCGVAVVMFGLRAMREDKSRRTRFENDDPLNPGSDSVTNSIRL